MQEFLFYSKSNFTQIACNTERPVSKQSGPFFLPVHYLNNVFMLNACFCS
jgi:hypothetical protein